jgi:hypothetical protein
MTLHHIGQVSDVQLSQVPRYYEPSPRRKNMRERMGLEALQKYKVQVQCKEIERIKVNADCKFLLTFS